MRHCYCKCLWVFVECTEMCGMDLQWGCRGIGWAEKQGKWGVSLCGGESKKLIFYQPKKMVFYTCSCVIILWQYAVLHHSVVMFYSENALDFSHQLSSIKPFGQWVRNYNLFSQLTLISTNIVCGQQWLILNKTTHAVVLICLTVMCGLTPEMG